MRNVALVLQPHFVQRVGGNPAAPPLQEVRYASDCSFVSPGPAHPSPVATAGQSTSGPACTFDPLGGPGLVGPLPGPRVSLLSTYRAAVAPCLSRPGAGRVARPPDWPATRLQFQRRFRHA